MPRLVIEAGPTQSLNEAGAVLRAAASEAAADDQAIVAAQRAGSHSRESSSSGSKTPPPTSPTTPGQQIVPASQEIEVRSARRGQSTETLDVVRTKRGASLESMGNRGVVAFWDDTGRASDARPFTASDRASSFDPVQDEDDSASVDAVDANRRGVIPCIFFAVFWTVAACVVLLYIVWVYAYEEVPKMEAVARQLTADSARLHIGEVLAPAVAAAAAVQASYRADGLSSLSGYSNISRMLLPHFAAWPSLLEVELVAGPGAVTEDDVPLGTGAVLLSRGLYGKIELRTDRADCADIGSVYGCAKEPLRSEESGWYLKSFDIGGMRYESETLILWHGPTFLVDDPNEVDCEVFCWRPAYAYVAQVAAASSVKAGSGSAIDAGPSTGNVIVEVDEFGRATSTSTTTTTTTTTPQPPDPVVLVRAAIDSMELRVVAQEAERVSRGEVIIATTLGEVVARSDMATALTADTRTGAVRPAHIWELSLPWIDSSEDWRDELTTFVRKGKGRTYSFGGFLVSCHELGGLENSTTSLADELRLLIAIPGESFVDTVLGPIVPLSVATGVAPIGVMALLSCWAAYLRMCSRNHGNEIIISPATRLS